MNVRSDRFGNLIWRYLSGNRRQIPSDAVFRSTVKPERGTVSSPVFPDQQLNFADIL
jgi:hypothetical protein